MRTERDSGSREPTPIHLERDWRTLLSELQVQYDSGALDTLKDILWVIGEQQKTAILLPHVWSSRKEGIEERVRRYYDLRGAEMAWVKDPNQPTVDPVLGFFLRYNRRRRVITFARENISILDDRLATDYLWAIAYPDLRLQLYNERVLTNRQGDVILNIRTDEKTFSQTDRQWRPGAVENYLQNIYNANPAIK